MEDNAETLLQRIRTLKSAAGGPLVAQQVFDAFQSDGEPWASFSLSRVRKACAKVNKECASAPAPPSALAALPAGGALAAGGLASSDGAVDLRAAYVDFRDSEMRWLYSLPVKRQAQLFDARSTGPNFPAQHVMQNGEVALLLAGQKPCVLFGHFKWQGSASEPSFGAALAKEVMSPWLEKFNLGPALGLSLHAIQGDQAASDSNGKCHFRGCWILVNERHPLAPEVRRVWLTPGTRHATVREQGRALGYPGVLTGANDCCRVYYMAIDKAPFLPPGRPDQGICCCVFLEYRALPLDAAAVAEHFQASLSALREKLGLEIYIDLEDMCYWPVHATALLCAKAFGSTDAAVDAMTKPPGYLKVWTGDNRAAQALLLVDECATALRAVGSRVRLTPASAQSRPSLRGAEGLGIAFEGRGDAEILVEVQLTAPPQAVAAHPPLGRVWVPPRLLTVDP